MTLSCLTYTLKSQSPHFVVKVRQFRVAMFGARISPTMVLTKQELISSLQSEVRILLHLSSKIDKSKLDYRPTPKQRSILELLQYMAIMGPTQIAAAKAGVFTREAMMALWGPADDSPLKR